MKRKALLFALGAALLPIGSLSAWDLPQEPTAPTVTSANFADVMEAQDTVYLFNVGAAQFFTCGNSWGTTASLGPNGLKILFQERTEMLEDVEVTGIGIQLAGPYVTGDNRNMHDTWLFRDNATSCFVDDNGRAHTVFDVAEVDGFYRIRQAALDPTYGSEYNEFYDYEWLGWDGTPGKTALTANLDPDAEGACCDWAILRLADAAAFQAAIAAYNARVALYATLERAQEVEADASDALALYNNPDATADQLAEANSTLKSAIDRAYYEQRWEDANEGNPLDVTDDCLVNPAFDDGNINGWLCTFRSGVNATDVGYQGDTYSNGDVTINCFIQAWRAAWGDNTAIIGDGELSQTLYGLPQGRYVLSADIISVHQNNGANNPVKGVYLFIKSGRFEERINVATGNNAPQHFQVEFLNEGADEMTFGLRTEGCNANWIAADNFRIEYYGKLEQSIERTMLAKTISECEDDGNDYCNAALYKAYTDAIDRAGELVDGGTDDECLAFIDELQAAFKAVNASRADYVELDKIKAHIDDVAYQVSENNPQWAALTTQLEALSDELEEKLSDMTADAAYLEEVRGKDMQMVRDYISTIEIKEGDDLTVLIENADFETTDADNTKVPGWTGSVKDHSKDFGDVEVYCMSAGIEQVIKNMPMGAYDITVQGYVRGNNEKAQLYAGDSKTTFKNIMDEYALEISFGTMEDRQANIDAGNVWPYDNGYTLDDGTEVYRPHSMQGAAAAFAKVNPMTGEPFYTNHCRIVLTQAGDLTIGVKAEFASGDPELWVIWDNFRIKYAGNEAYMYADEIANRQEAVRKALEAEGAVITNEAQRRADAAILAGDEAIAGTSVDACIAAMKQLDEAAAYAAEGAGLSRDLLSVAEFYYGLLETVYSSDVDYYEFVTAVYEQDDSQTYESNEDIKAAADRIRDGWAAYVMYDVKDLASPDSPEDVTPIIYNSDYLDPITMDYSANGWDVVTDGGTNTANEGELECFSNNSFNVSQSLSGLAPGYYLLGVSGFYRPGGSEQINDSLAAVCHAKLYAETAEGTFDQPLMNAMAGAQEQREEVGAESAVTLSDGVERFIPNDRVAAKLYMDLSYYPNELIIQVGEDGKATIGIRKDEHIVNDWTVFTFWTLAYMGTEPPVAVKGIQADAALRQADSAVYDLSGRRVASLKSGRGIYIQNGRKVVVK